MGKQWQGTQTYEFERRRAESSLRAIRDRWRTEASDAKFPQKLSSLNKCKAELASYNIDTAADVTLSAVDAVPGFGQFLTGQLLAWRQTLEGKFVFNPKRGIDPEDVRTLDREMAATKTSLESSLLRGPSELARTRIQTTATRQSLAKELENATRELLQAEANARAS